MKIRSKPYPKTVKSGWNIITIKSYCFTRPTPGNSDKVAVAQEDKRITAKAKKKLFLHNPFYLETKIQN